MVPAAGGERVIASYDERVVRGWRRGAWFFLIVLVGMAALVMRDVHGILSVTNGYLHVWSRGYWHWQVFMIATEAWRLVTTWMMVGAFAGVAGIPAGRAMMRAHLHRGRSDLAARIAAWGAKRRPWLWAVGASVTACSVSLAVVQADVMWPARAPVPVGWAASLLAGAFSLTTLAAYLLGKAGWRLLTAPLTDPDAEATHAGEADRMTFDAVAVTREARIGLVLMALLGSGAAMVAGFSDLRSWSFLPTFVVAAPVVYALAAAALITQFLRASRITIGLDGILIHGTSRKRFFGFHDLDRAESTEWGEILLYRGDSVVLRLQPHGEDAARRADLAARIQGCIDGSRALASGTARRLAETATTTAMRGVARGGDGYRTTGVGRDELWQLVEAPVASSDHRCAAADALGSALTAAEGRRMRIAAEHCADPAARATLLRIAATAAAGASGDEASEHDEEAAGLDEARRDPARRPAARLGV